jgi:hypothetical protein
MTRQASPPHRPAAPPSARHPRHEGALRKDIDAKYAPPDGSQEGPEEAGPGEARMRPGDRQSRILVIRCIVGGWPDKGPRSSAVRPAGDAYRVSAAGQVERARCTCERHR